MLSVLIRQQFVINLELRRRGTEFFVDRHVLRILDCVFSLIEKFELSFGKRCVSILHRSARNMKHEQEALGFRFTNRPKRGSRIAGLPQDFRT